MANCEWCDAPVPLGDVAYSRHPDPHDCLVTLRADLARVEGERDKALKRADANTTLLAAAAIGASEMIKSHDAAVARADAAERDLASMTAKRDEALLEIARLRGVVGEHAASMAANRGMYDAAVAMGVAAERDLAAEHARAEVEALRTAIGGALAWWEKVYPRDVFPDDWTGDDDRDPGPAQVVAIRKALNAAVARGRSAG